MMHFITIYPIKQLTNTNSRLFSRPHTPNYHFQCFFTSITYSFERNKFQKRPNTSVIRKWYNLGQCDTISTIMKGCRTAVSSSRTCSRRLLSHFCVFFPAKMVEMASKKRIYSKCHTLVCDIFISKNEPAKTVVTRPTLFLALYLQLRMIVNRSLSFLHVFASRCLEVKRNHPRNRTSKANLTTQQLK